MEKPFPAINCYNGNIGNIKLILTIKENSKPLRRQKHSTLFLRLCSDLSYPNMTFPTVGCSLELFFCYQSIASSKAFCC